MDEIATLLAGAALAVLGGFIQHLWATWRDRKHEKGVLICALRAESKMLRDDLGVALDGYRRSLLADDRPSVLEFQLGTPVFDASCSQFGRLWDHDLIEQVVEVFSSVRSLRERAAALAQQAASDSSIQSLNEAHIAASNTHLALINLHNRLAEKTVVMRGLEQVESDTFHFCQHIDSVLNQGQGTFRQLVETPWKDQQLNWARL